MAYEIDFLAVGEGERSGDAIAIRYGNLTGPRDQQKIIVIDGGSRESGERLVDHIKTVYRTDFVNFVVLTHPDADHASGLIPVLDQLKVGTLLMHLPWNYAGGIKDLFQDGRCTCNGLNQRTKEAFEAAHELQKIATRKGVKIHEPFAGTYYGTDFRVLGPSQEFYIKQLSAFRCMPETTEASNIFGKLAQAARAVVRWITETWHSETLAEPDTDATSAENQSSVILLLTLDGKSLLFTGDAGVAALDAAAAYAESIGIDLKTLSFVQIPHHGSKRNVGPSVLNRILGPILPNDNPTRTAYVSASKEGEPKHPNKRVMNAFRRRGFAVHTTQGQSKWHRSAGVADRQGYAAAQPQPFHAQVEEDI